jgi:hypothetical protein
MSKLQNKIAAFKAERAERGYRVFEDQDGKTWRANKNGTGKMILINDPNFVHEAEPLPTVKLFGRDVEPLGATAAGVGVLVVFLLGTLVA